MFRRRRSRFLSFLTYIGVAIWLRLCQAANDAGLPLIQISHDDLGEDYPEMREEVHLEDFFWTGSGDGPPDYLKKVHIGINKGKDVIVKTETVVATVYVDGNNEIDIPICLDCPPDDGGSTWDLGGSFPPLNYSATDRRYWLLTVMSGFYAQKDNPLLEEKLARLYRLAFTRQQSKHLGINGAQHIAGIAVTNARERRGGHKTGQHLQETTTAAGDKKNLDVEILDMIGVQQPSASELLPTNQETNRKSELETSSEEVEYLAGFTSTATQVPDDIGSSSPAHEAEASSTTALPPFVTIVPWELIQQDAKSERQVAPPPPQAPRAMLRGAQVRVVIHNITQITEEEVQRGGHNTGAYDMDVNEKIDERPVANQTELIYSVFVNGRPVLAVTAANDMKLVTEMEAANIIGQEVYMKAEPYLREPQATPLAPAIRSSRSGFIDSIQNNTALVVVSTIAILLLLLLLVALLLMGRSRSRERQKLEEQRTTSRNELLAELQSGRGTSMETGLATGRSTTQSRDIGIQNFSFEHDNDQHRRREARINFPSPPAERDYRRDSLTSTDNTSDSSVYCPINPPPPDVQRILDEKAATLFDQHRRRHQHQYDQAEGHEAAVYTPVVADKKHDKSRRKTKRRYLSENRVGSLETSPKTQHHAHSSGDEVVSGSLDDDNLSPTYENFERNEAFNPHNNYHRNKLLHQKRVLHEKDQQEEFHTTEAINKEIINALQPAERSSDTGSIGSFLSMASVKAFPKSSLPQPLNRVLDPVFVTYFDHADESMSRKQTALVKSPHTRQRTPGTGGSLDALRIDSFPTPKAPLETHLVASQSDNPDPGVVGPIVWERHKKRMSESLDAATDDAGYVGMLHNPAAIRTHYEDLLEGAMQMYSGQDDLPMPLPTRDFSNKRNPTKRENRGSSAGQSSKANKAHNIEDRPATAQPRKVTNSNQSTQPPSPASGAWGGSLHGSHSPLVRPLSAGPFHRPDEVLKMQPPKSASNRSDLSTAPLIEAIKSELRKFKQEHHQ